MAASCYSVEFCFSSDSLTWLVKHGPQVLSRHLRKRDAVRQAAVLAKSASPSILVIERMDGSREGERRYGTP